jgi:hypothetical protein
MSFMDPIVPKFMQLSADDLPERDRLEIIRAVYGRAILRHDFEPMGDGLFQFHASLDDVPALGLASTDISPCIAARGPERIHSAVGKS